MKYQVLAYDTQTHSGRPVIFNTKEEAINYYKENKNDLTKYGWSIIAFENGYITDYILDEFEGIQDF